MRPRAFALLPLLLTLLPLACRSRTAMDESWTGNDDNGSRGPLRETVQLGQEEADAGAMAAWIGVRNDVNLDDAAARTARCACLDVELGAATDPRFVWQGDPPVVGDNAIVAVISPRGIACPGVPGDDKNRRASISAVDVENGNVLIEIEDLSEGRPLALGAIIPRPSVGGGVYVRPKNNRVPYARTNPPTSCRVQ